MHPAPAAIAKSTELRRRARRAGERGVLAPALAASAALHVAAFLLISFPVDRAAPRTSRTAPEVVHVAPIMQAVDLAITDDDAVATEPDRGARPLPPTRSARRDRTRDVPRDVEVPEDAAADAAVRRASAAERLQYRAGSAGVWGELPPVPLEERSRDEVVRARIAARIGAYNDSIAADAAARAAALDWTTTDANGGRWGVSPGGIHLGGVTLPIPFSFSTPPGRRDEMADYMRTWNEISDQATRAANRDSFNDRVKAIRERKDQERAEQGGGGN